MYKRFLALSLCILVMPLMAHAVQGACNPNDKPDIVQLRQEIQAGTAKNIILLIGDGMGDSEITAARNYKVGAAQRLAMDCLPFTGSVTTYALQEDFPTKPNYVTDSAAGGTAWATGRKTSNGRISTLPANDTKEKPPVPPQTILELAQKKGYRTGNVSTAEITDATPAVLGAHVNKRQCQGPQDMQACPMYRKSANGPGSIAEQLIDHKIEVILGGGRQRFQQLIDDGQGKTVIDSAREQGYLIVETAQELAHSRPGEHQRLLGLFTKGNMSMEWDGEEALPFPDSSTHPPQHCKEVQRPANEPALADMMNTAIHWLERTGSSSRGFFLQVEGAQIDKRAHIAQPCQQIGETIAFDDAIRDALKYAREHPGTLVIVTADHGHSTQIVPIPDKEDHGSGRMSTLVTRDNSEMTIHYGTNQACCSPGHDMEHTGTQVHIGAIGPQAFGVLGVHDMTDVFHLMARALGAE
jgi:alkaline phosphatase